MARISGSQSHWLRTASRATLLASLLLPSAVGAQDREDSPTAAVSDTTALVDRAQLAGAVTLDKVGLMTGLIGTPLVLAVTVNGMDHGLAQFQLIDDELWATPAILRNLGLRLDEGEEQSVQLLALETLAGNTVAYNASNQSVTLMVDVARLAVGTARLNAVEQDTPIAASSTGALVNYDLFANLNGGRLSFDGYTETRFFSGNSLLENTALFRASDSGGSWGGKVTRLDTAFSMSFPEKRLTIRAGDIVTRGTGWSRPTRLGGLRIGTDFALQPYLVTAPIPKFFGEATLPSTVDLYIDGLKRYSGQISPGTFELGLGANQITGAGTAQVVVTDALGQVSTVNLPIYDTPLLLRKGLSDWSVELGAVRENYGNKSFDYDSKPAISASLRHGMSDLLTLEAHGEGSDGLVNGGAGFAWITPMGGVIAGSVAGSHSQGKTGHRVEGGFSWSDSRFNIAATVQRASDEFSDLASLNGSRIPVARDLASVGFNSGKYGSFGASLLRQRYAGEASDAYASLNWHKGIGDRASLSFSANQNLNDSSDRSLFVTLSFSPKKRDHFSASAQFNDFRESASLSYHRSVPYEGGLGFAVNTAYSSDSFRASAQLDHLGSKGQVTAGARLVGGNVSGYAGYSGSLVAMDGGVFITRKIFDGFALVSTDGMSDVPVELHNREIGKTNSDGHLLITGLNAYQRNRVSIDQSDISANYFVQRLSQEVVPSLRAGVKVDFAITPTKSVLMTLVDAQGEFLPVQTAASMDGADNDAQSLMVGFDGQLFIEYAKEGAIVTFDLDDGACRIRLPDALPSDKAGRLGTLTCMGDA